MIKARKCWKSGLTFSMKEINKTTFVMDFEEHMVIFP